MAGNKIATSKDVALLAGVSQATVSRAFSNSVNLAPETRDKVMSAAKMLHYQPNAFARGLVMSQSNVIAIVKGYTQNAMFSEMFSEMVYNLQRADKRVIYFETEKGQPIDELSSKILRYQIEGLILMYADLTSELTVNCQQRDIPVVQLHRYSTAIKTNAVLPDNYAAAETAAALFIRNGFSNFVYLGGESNSSSNMERQLGFSKYLVESGFSVPQTWNGAYTYESGAEAMRALVPKKQFPCAILCANDLMAFGAIDTLRFEYGLRIGEDVSLIGFDNLATGEWPSYSLTTFAQPTSQMAKDAIELLFARIDDKTMAPVEKRYPLTLIERGTTKKSRRV